MVDRGTLMHGTVIADVSRGDPFPFDFGQKPMNSVADYERLRRVRRHVWDRGWRWQGDAKKLAAEIGISFIRFQRSREPWNNLARPVPQKYLAAIGIEMPTLQTALALDQADYDKALMLAEFPTHYNVKLMPAVFISKKLPPGLTEKEAVEYLRTTEWHRNGRKCYISWPGLKLLILWEDGKIGTVHYRPEMTIEKGLVHFGDDGENACRMRIG